jgi:hypothetical protein
LPLAAQVFDRPEGYACQLCGALAAAAEWVQRSIRWLDQHGINGPERARLLAAWGCAS